MSLTGTVLRAALIAGVAAASVYSMTAVAQTATASGEVRRIDAEAGKITIKHGAIADLQLPAMTLVYRIDPSLLAGIKPGDTVSFTAQRQDNGYVIIQRKK